MVEPFFSRTKDDGLSTALVALLRVQDEKLLTLISESGKLTEYKFKEGREALNLARTEMLRRLVELNHAHELAREKERDFIQKDAFNTFSNRTADDFGVLRKEIQTTASSVNTTKEQAAKALADALSEQAKLGEARFSRLEKSQSMMIGGLVLIGAFVPIVVFFLTRGRI